MNDTVRVYGVREFLALAPEPEPGPDPALRQCTRDGCTMTLRPPWKRPPGPRHDYHAAKCVPEWLTQLPLSYAVRPRDVWVRSGARVADPTVPVGPPLASTVPRYHEVCTDCGSAVHGLHIAQTLCPDCIVEHVIKITRAAYRDEAERITDVVLAAMGAP